MNFLAAVGAYAGHIIGLPKKGTRSFESLEELLPFLADRLDEDDTWAILEGLKGARFPRGFVLPSIPPAVRTTGGNAGHSAGPPKRAPKPPAAVGERGKRGAGKPYEDVTRKFEHPDERRYLHVVIAGSTYKLCKGAIGGKAMRPIVYRFPIDFPHGRRRTPRLAISSSTPCEGPGASSAGSFAATTSPATRGPPSRASTNVGVDGGGRAEVQVRPTRSCRWRRGAVGRS